MENFETFKSIQTKLDRDRIWLAVSVADMAIGYVVPTDMRIGLFVAVFMFMTGLIFGVLIVLDIVMSTVNYHDWHKAQLSAYRLQNGLPLPKHEAQNIKAHEPEPTKPAEPKQPINVIHETKDSQGRISTWTIENHPDRPSFDFIKHVYTCKDDSNLIPTVRELQDEGKLNGLWNTAQVVKWLTIFDQLEITTKIYDMERGNSRRCLKRGMTLNEIREKFGYEVKE